MVNFNDAFNGRQPPSGLDAFDSTVPAPEFSPLPGGVYRVRVASFALSQTRKGDDCVVMRFVVTEGPHTGRVLTKFFTFGPRALPYTRRDLGLFGLDSKEKLLNPWPPAGQDVYATLIVALQRDDAGIERNDIKAIRNVEFRGSAVAPYLIDTEGGPV